MTDRIFFVKLDNLKQTEILDFLVHNGTEVVVKIWDRHYKSKILNRHNIKTFAIHKFSLAACYDENIVCSFEIKDDKYFFKSNLNSTDSEYLIDIPSEIFQLQRRNDFRVSIPMNASYTCYLKSVNSQYCNHKVELRDISLGGCLIAVPEKLIKVQVDQEVILSLKMNQFEDEKIMTTAKHIKKVESQHMQLVGLKYIEPDAAFLTELQGLLVYLDRVQRGKGYD